MIGYVIRRLLYGVLILIGVNLFTFILFFAVNTPDDMARLAIGGQRVSQDAVEKWKAERGYDKPLYVNERKQGTERFTETIFWDRSVSLFKLDFGRADAESAGDIGFQVRSRMIASLQLALPLFILQVIASTAFALQLVLFRNSRIDFWGVVLCVLMLSISSLFYIIVGQFLFSRIFKLVPISGYAEGLDAVKFLILPVLLALLARLGGESRLYRAMFLEEVGKDYVRTARAKGLSEWVVIRGHVLKNALIPVVTVLGLQLGTLIGGAVITEYVFALPGVGRLVVDAVFARDYPLVQGVILLIALGFIVSNLLVDLVYGWIDPRIRLR